MRRARAFNLGRAELLASVVEPWLEDRPLELGDREWLPRDSSLKILEGPALDPAELSFGQGWANAERSCDNVTRRVLEEAPPPRVPDAYVVESEAVEALIREGFDGPAPRALPWDEAKRMLDGRDPEIAAVVLVRRRPGSPAPPRTRG